MPIKRLVDYLHRPKVIRPTEAGTVWEEAKKRDLEGPNACDGLLERTELSDYVKRLNTEKIAALRDPDFMDWEMDDLDRDILESRQILRGMDAHNADAIDYLTGKLTQEALESATFPEDREHPSEPIQPHVQLRMRRRAAELLSLDGPPNRRPSEIDQDMIYRACGRYYDMKGPSEHVLSERRKGLEDIQALCRYLELYFPS